MLSVWGAVSLSSLVVWPPTVAVLSIVLLPRQYCYHPAFLELDLLNPFPVHFVMSFLPFLPLSRPSSFTLLMYMKNSANSISTSTSFTPTYFCTSLLPTPPPPTHTSVHHFFRPHIFTPTRPLLLLPTAHTFMQITVRKTKGSILSVVIAKAAGRMTGGDREGGMDSVVHTFAKHRKGWLNLKKCCHTQVLLRVKKYITGLDAPS